MKMLNVACGDRFHEAWINIDFHPVDNRVKKVNILLGLPFQDNSFDFVYTSHFLEHLTPEQADFVLSEIKRVLKIDGIVRVVVPDLENICKEYLRILDMVLKDDQYEEQYEWITVELLDQLVRNKPGGKMYEIYQRILSSKNNKLNDYVFYRVGVNILKNEAKNIPYRKTIRRITWDKIKNKLLYIYIKLISFLIPKDIRDYVFVQTSIGEKHLWMYDRYSLTSKLKKIGFRDIQLMEYNKSQIPNFNDYLLDINEDGTPHKGISSLYIEAKK